MRPAARVNDNHTCPLNSPAPHVGGPIVGGVSGVLIDYRPAARVGSPCVCAGATDVITAGSSTVLIGGRNAARMGDPTTHGGVITEGYPQVLIGE